MTFPRGECPSAEGAGGRGAAGADRGFTETEAQSDLRGQPEGDCPSVCPFRPGGLRLRLHGATFGFLGDSATL